MFADRNELINVSSTCLVSLVCALIVEKKIYAERCFSPINFHKAF